MMKSYLSVLALFAATSAFAMTEEQECVLNLLEQLSLNSPSRTLNDLRVKGLKLEPGFGRGAGGAPVQTRGEAKKLKGLDIYTSETGDVFTWNQKKFQIENLDRDGSEIRFWAKSLGTGPRQEIAITYGRRFRTSDTVLSVSELSGQRYRPSKRYEIEIAESFEPVAGWSERALLAYAGTDLPHSFTTPKGIEAVALTDFDRHAPKKGQLFGWQDYSYTISKVTKAADGTVTVVATGQARSRIRGPHSIRPATHDIVIRMEPLELEGQSAVLIEIREPTMKGKGGSERAMKERGTHFYKGIFRT